MGKEQTEPDFAKIVRVDGRQVLFYMEPDGDTHAINQIVCISSGAIMTNVKIEGVNSDYVDERFAKISTEENARSVIELIEDFYSKSVLDGASKCADEGDSQ